MGPLNLPATLPYHASQMYARNVANFVGSMAADGQLGWDLEDEVVRETLVIRDGEIVHPRVREILGLSTAQS
jgi:NAD(P) transhydrogenase subunit alpha